MAQRAMLGGVLNNNVKYIQEIFYYVCIKVVTVIAFPKIEHQEILHFENIPT